MDHPSRGLYLPSRVDSMHGHTVPYGWGTCQTEHIRLKPLNYPRAEMVRTREMIGRIHMQTALWKPL
jgi:hypothetical protein